MNCNTCLKPSKKQGTYNLNQVSGCNMEFIVEEIKKINTNDEVPYLKNLVGKKLNFYRTRVRSLFTLVTN